jgi:5-methylcytosine-specific restriction endonuclease McrA
MDIESLKIIQIAEARSLGLKKYYTGRPCPNGHITDRYTNNASCVVCQYEIRRKWVKNNLEKVRKYGRDCARRNWAIPEKRKQSIARSRKWLDTADNKEKYKAVKKRYRQNNKLKKCIDQHRRRAKLKLAGGSHTEQQIVGLLVKQKNKCINCLCNISSRPQIDHIMPIALGGNNSIENIQLLCKSCNSKKQAQDPLVWAKKNGRLF